MEPSGLYLSNFGTGLDEIVSFTNKLTGIVKTMRERMVDEEKVLEYECNAEMLKYVPIHVEWSPDEIAKAKTELAKPKNELSKGETKKD